MSRGPLFSLFFFFNDTATTEIYTLSLHDALPIYQGPAPVIEGLPVVGVQVHTRAELPLGVRDRKSTRLNSSHSQISYAVFCLKKKNKKLTAATRAHTARMSATDISDVKSVVYAVV